MMFQGRNLWSTGRAVVWALALAGLLAPQLGWAQSTPELVDRIVAIVDDSAS